MSTYNNDPTSSFIKLALHLDSMMCHFHEKINFLLKDKSKNFEETNLHNWKIFHGMKFKKIKLRRNQFQIVNKTKKQNHWFLEQRLDQINNTMNLFKQI